MKAVTTYFPSVDAVKQAADNLHKVVETTPLLESFNLSNEHQAKILLKREDLQVVRSYKIRGAYNKMISLAPEELANGVVCASAGNHAQGVAYCCNALGINGVIFMPTPTPAQKIEQVRMFGNGFVEIKLVGDTFDDANLAAQEYCALNDSTFVHPFNDEKVIEGQATIALEILEQAKKPIDYLFLPVGGGGLASGVSAIFKHLSPHTKVIGVEPADAPSMSTSIENGFNTELESIDQFIDGASVKKVGDLTFNICKETLDEMTTVETGKVCETILKLYNKDAIVVEPAGVMTLAVLDQYKDAIKGKNVVCLISGSNSDITRTEEIKERALLYAGLKHYFIIRFPQRPKALMEFLVEVLGEHDDITHFEYTKKHNREKGPAVVGIELKSKSDLEPLMNRMNQYKFTYEHLNLRQDLLNLLI